MESYKIWSSWPKDDQKPSLVVDLVSYPKELHFINTWICLEFQNPQKFPKTDRWFERRKKIGCKTNGFLSPVSGDPAGHLPLTNLIRGRDLLLTLGWAIFWGSQFIVKLKGILQNFWPSKFDLNFITCFFHYLGDVSSPLFTSWKKYTWKLAKIRHIIYSLFHMFSFSHVGVVSQMGTWTQHEVVASTSSLCCRHSW